MDWDALASDQHGERLRACTSAARQGVSDLWGVLSGATSEDDWNNRVALVNDRIDDVVGRSVGDDTGLFLEVRQAVLESLHEDYLALAKERVHQAYEAAKREDERKAREAKVREKKQAAYQMEMDDYGDSRYPIILFDADGNVVDRAANLATAETIINQSHLPVASWFIPDTGVGYVSGTDMSKERADEYLQWVLRTSTDLWTNPVEARRKGGRRPFVRRPQGARKTAGQYRVTIYEEMDFTEAADEFIFEGSAEEFSAFMREQFDVDNAGQSGRESFRPDATNGAGWSISWGRGTATSDDEIVYPSDFLTASKRRKQATYPESGGTPFWSDEDYDRRRGAYYINGYRVEPRESPDGTSYMIHDPSGEYVTTLMRASEVEPLIRRLGTRKTAGSWQRGSYNPPGSPTRWVMDIEGPGDTFYTLDAYEDGKWYVGYVAPSGAEVDVEEGVADDLESAKAEAEAAVSYILGIGFSYDDMNAVGRRTRRRASKGGGRRPFVGRPRRDLARQAGSYGYTECPKCGKNNHENATKCAHCDAKLSDNKHWTSRRRQAGYWRNEIDMARSDKALASEALELGLRMPSWVRKEVEDVANGRKNNFDPDLGVASELAILFDRQGYHLVNASRRTAGNGDWDEPKAWDVKGAPIYLGDSVRILSDNYDLDVNEGVVEDITTFGELQIELTDGEYAQIHSTQCRILDGRDPEYGPGFHLDASRKTAAEGGEHWLDAARRVVQNGQYETIEGQVLDTTTAGLLVSIADQLQDPANQERFSSMSLTEATNVAVSLMEQGSVDVSFAKKKANQQKDLFLSQFADLGRALEDSGAIRMESDGFQWVDESVADPEILRLYNQMRVDGYALGYFARRVANPYAPNSPDNAYMQAQTPDAANYGPVDQSNTESDRPVGDTIAPDDAEPAAMVTTEG